MLQHPSQLNVQPARWWGGNQLGDNFELTLYSLSVLLIEGKEKQCAEWTTNWTNV